MSDLPSQLTPANPVHDPVHGRIWLTSLEVDLINTPDFQRLRRIAQLAPADFVFPGATHNRFAHSLGAMHVMGWILRQENLQRYFRESDRENCIALLRVAALLHDIGHLPFSHVGETAWAISRTSSFHTHEEQGLTVFDLVAESGARGPYHEHLSVDLIRGSQIGDIINRHLPGTGFEGYDATEAVIRIINGTEPNLVMRSLLSSDIDCDRLDYLVRDSLAAGLVYGQVDLAYLIGNLVVCRRDTPRAGRGDVIDDAVLAVDRKHGLLAGEHYLLARYYHYAQFISHKTITSAEITLAAGILELIRSEELPSAEQIDTDIMDPSRRQSFLTLTDALVETKLTTAATHRKARRELKEIAARLRERKLMKSVARDEGLEEKRKLGDPPRHHWDSVLHRAPDKRVFAEAHGIDPAYFCFSRTVQGLSGAQAGMSPTDFIGDPSEVERSWEKAAKVGEHDGKPKLLIDESQILGHLSNKVWTTRRVFAREPLSRYGSDERTRQFKKLRKAIASIGASS